MLQVMKDEVTNKNSKDVIAFTLGVIAGPLIIVKLLMLCCGIESMSNDDPKEGKSVCQLHEGLL